MSTYDPSTWLKYANLQMAAEAFLIDEVTGESQFSGDKLKNALVLVGNKHASKFTETQAADFIRQYDVVAHIPNTGSGFSGTLFKDRATGEYTLSFRSTEFVEDVIADSVGTNEGISQYGWAFGQIADMEEWWDTLQTSVPDLTTKGFVLTGYSLGGHLATAFAQLRAEENNGTPPAYLQHVYTYNGAGTGGIADGKSLTEVMQLFIDVWKKGVEPPWLLNVQSLVDNEAIKNFAKISLETSTVNGYVSGIAGDGTTPVVSRPGYFADYRFHYAMAVAGRLTSGALGETDLYAIFDSSKAAVEGMQFDGLMTELLGSGMSGVAIGGLRHTSTRTEIEIEDQPLTRGTPRRLATGPVRLTNQYGLNDFADTHSLVLIVDSLAIMDTFARLDPNLDQSTAERIFKAASAAKRDTVPRGQGKAEGDVLENVLDVLVQMFTHTDPKLRDGKTATGDDLNTGGTWADGTLRTNFYNQLDALQKSDEFTAVRGKVTVDVPSPSLLPTVARTDFASLLTLLTLSPFTLKTIAGKESEVETVLRTKWGTEYTDWQADQALSPAQRAAGQGNYTETYLQDRAQMLGYLSQYNLTNGQRNVDPSVPTISRVYRDVDKDINLIVDRTSNTTPNNLLRPQIIFGGDNNDMLWGSDEADRLYGGASMDRLDGGKGNDYIEGNAGSDILTGGEGRDTLHGGSGNDILDGGKGSDTLMGGLGDDTYLIGDGGGWDWIDDVGGNDRLIYRAGATEIPLTGGESVAPNVWKQESNGQTFWYILTDWTEGGETYQRLSIQGPDGGVFIKDWSAGKLGITLPGATPAPQQTILLGTDGNDNPNLVALPHTNIALQDTAANQKVYGLAGADLLYISQSGSIGYGGSGNDILNGGGHDQELYGEDGNDILYGNAGNNKLDGGLNDDFLQGGIGNDQLDGGEGLDFIDGGAGSDLIKGGGGDDFILGDGNTGINLSTATNDQGKNDYDRLAEGSLTLLQNIGGQLVLPQNLVGATLVEGGGADIIDAGAGNDWVLAGDGGDSIQGGSGNDYLVGQAGGDRIEGGDDDDHLYGDGAQGDLTIAGQEAYTPPAEHGDDYLDGARDMNSPLDGWNLGLRLASDSQGDDQLHRSMTVKNMANGRLFEFAANQIWRLAA